MLRDKHRVSAEWRLFTVIGDDGRYQAFAENVLGMNQYHLKTFMAQDSEFFAAQTKPAAKIGFSQRVE